ncbi:MAG TPA: terminase family protein [Vitreimonas sp.]|uniref:terminase large subunit domain-containing protein n=1 Tax=Vitreimonas sp. TaxID=3069702 RepID=UPI002D40D86D|nr:terminase family protein [Vitreimonas sp.]HYD89183.1 terminase family protein [Vitreimonas sp.]
MRSSSKSQRTELKTEWSFWGREQQLPPPGDWRTWLFMGGRGAGKTRAGAEWVAARAREGSSGRIALVGPTFHDVREVMIEGQSGLRALGRDRPRYEASRRRVLWPNGAQAFALSAEDPESLRGPQFDTAWCDELCFWAHSEETLATLEHGLRLGERPRMMVTTTPRPIRALKRLIAAPDTLITCSSTWENAHNVAQDFIAALNQRWGGTAQHRQELLGELIEDLDGALWSAR